MKPVYWKPRYATRRMRERAFADADLERERRAGGASLGKQSFLSRLMRPFR